MKVNYNESEAAKQKQYYLYYNNYNNIEFMIIKEIRCEMNQK